MAPTLPSPPPFGDSCFVLPYDQATLEQKSLALRSVQQELQAHFPTLPWLTWAETFDQLQLPLLVEADTVGLDYHDLKRLTQFLAQKSTRWQLDPPLYCNKAFYLARKLDTLAGFALLAVEELEANPLACGPRTLEVILKLAEDNGIVLEVLQAMGGAKSMEQQRAAALIADETGVYSVSERLRQLAHLYQAAARAQRGE